DVLLPALHTILQVAMGWTDSHLHQFSVADLRFAEPDNESDPTPIDYRSITLNQILPRSGATCVYEYDFGDSWEHLVEVEDELARETVADPLPRCVDGARACPPEDCGGMHGYELFLEAIGDQRHPEHDDYVRWVGGGFDPETFDIGAVNKKLPAVARVRRGGSN
ncbi:MAG: plasmid pRiA4b ORF-3 family protein, partial [bacterium]